MRPPDQSGRWEVSAYLWSPGQIVVREGDDVVIDFVGINGASHPTEIRGLGKAFALNRGNVVGVEFKAERVGVYPPSAPRINPPCAARWSSCRRPEA
jgi:hypothetical protein